MVSGGLGGVSALEAATHLPSQQSPPAWHAVETASFRILNFGSRPVDRQTAQACEHARELLARRWLGSADHAWSPKCVLILHATKEAYLREVGSAARTTLGSTLLDRRQGRIARRRIDLCAEHPAWNSAALAHELTHVVLADIAADEPLPRWVDEGIAILADPADKQSRHQADLRAAIRGRGEYRLAELVGLGDYPAADRWATFYAQSASLVRFLVDLGGEERLIRFVQAALAEGYERAAINVYQIRLADLERRWQAAMRGNSVAERRVGHSSRGPTPLTTAFVEHRAPHGE